MRRIVLALILLAFIILGLYAFIPQVKAYLDTALGPSVGSFFGSTYTSIVQSPLWINYVAPPLNAFCIGLIVMGFFAFFWHKTYNKFRAKIIRGAYKETGAVTMTEPIQTVTTPTPTPTAPAKEKEDKT